MSHKAWNDLTPAMAPVVAHGPQTVFVAPMTFGIGGMPPFVIMRVGEPTDSQLMQLSPSEARRVAIALLQAAEKVETTPPPVPVRSS